MGIYLFIYLASLKKSIYGRVSLWLNFEKSATPVTFVDLASILYTGEKEDNQINIVYLMQSLFFIHF